MSHELVYTSATQGLKPGSYGFCTVMATEDLPKVLQDRLESLSGYEPAFALTDRRASLNPVNYSYLIVTVANQKLHLLSRVADAGADYSGRSNKLAHHVALQPNELTASGPALALATPGFCKTSFDGNPRALPQGVKPPTTPRPLGKCSAWEAVCKEAGWAGVLVEQTLKNPARPITLIYPPGCDVLPLVVEAMSLLPAELQWRTTFSTFFTKLPAGLECQWRFVLDGTPAAEQARRNLQSPPINLINPGPVSIGGPLVEAARTGQPAISHSTVGSSSLPPLPNAPRSALPASTSTARVASTESTEGYKLGPPPKSMRHARPTTVPSVDNLFAKRGPSKALLAVAIGGGVAALAVVVSIVVLIVGGLSAPLPATTPADQQPTVAVNQQPPNLFNQPVAAKHERSAPPSFTEATDTKITPADVPKEVEVEVNEVPLTAAVLFKDIMAKGGVLSLPKREQGIATIAAGEQELCKIFVKQPADCELVLVTTETLDDGQPRLFLERQPPQDNGVQVWIATAGSKNRTFNVIEKQQIGSFKLKDQLLTFEWKADAPDWTAPFGLLYCKLDVRVGKERTRCSLTQRTTMPPERVAFSARKASLKVEIPAGSLSSVKSLRYDMELKLGGWSEFKTRVGAGEKLKFEIPEEDPGTNVDLEVQFVEPTSRKEAKFAYGAYVYLNCIKPQPGLRQGFTLQRSDDVNDVMKDGLIFADLEKMKKQAIDDEKKANNVELPKAKSAVKEKEKELSRATFLEEKLAIQETLNGLEDNLKKIQDAIAKGAEAIKWTATMESRLKLIEANLEVRFTIYLEFPSDSGTEKVVLVETNPPPSKPIAPAKAEIRKPEERDAVPKDSPKPKGD